MGLPFTKIGITGGGGLSCWGIKLEFSPNIIFKKSCQRIWMSLGFGGVVWTGDINLQVLSMQNLKAMRVDEKLSPRN